MQLETILVISKYSFAKIDYLTIWLSITLLYTTNTFPVVRMMHRVYQFWQANPALWFNATPADDAKITSDFEHLLVESYDKNYKFSPIKEWTGYVILFDQLRRHINRSSDKSYPEPDHFIQHCYDNYKKYKNEITDFEFMFILMPIRHTHMLEHVKFVLAESWARLEHPSADNSQHEPATIRKYIKATYERYIKLGVDHTSSTIKQPTQNQFPLEIMSILDTERMGPYMPAPIDLSLIPAEHPLIQKMRDFIRQNNLAGKTIIVSLSGGVDSMVCSYLLRAIGHPVIAVHINYMNRVECPLEVELLKYWCSSIGELPLYVRTIDEINRPLCMKYELRDIYESYTRDARYMAYLYCDQPSTEQAAIQQYASYVMLGHNKDDTIENIFTNIASGSHLDNLLGMTEYSRQIFADEEIYFLRPLLDVPKSAIYEFANLANIPYLIDSTPAWSQRGMIRDIVCPALKSWNPAVQDGFISLSAKLTEMTQLINQLIPSWCPDGFDSLNAIPISKMYWSTVFRKNQLQVSQKTLNTFLDKIIYLQQHPEKLVINQPTRFTLCKNASFAFTREEFGYINTEIIISSQV